LDWDRFENILLQTDLAHGTIHIGLFNMHPGYFEQLMTLLQEGNVLAQLQSFRHHSIIFTYQEPELPFESWQIASADVVSSTLQEVVVNDKTLELDPLERFGLWLQRNHANRESYVKELLARDPKSTR
jgi:hypothetical protein